MRALFDESALVENQDAVRVAQSAQTVGDRQRRAAASENVERFLDRLLRLGVDAARGFVEYQDLGIVEQGTRDRDPLPLAPGKACSTLAQPRIVSERRAKDEVVCQGRTRGGDRIGQAGVGPAVNQVVVDRAAKQERLLEHDAHIPAEVALGQLTDVDSIEQYPSGVDIIEAADQVHECRLAAAAVTDNTDLFARPDDEVDLLEYRSMPLVAKRNIVESDLAASVWQGLGPRRVVRVGRRIQQLEDALTSGQEAGQPGRQLRESGKGSVKHGEIGEKRHQRAQGHRARQHIAASDVPDDQAPETKDQSHDGRERSGGFFDSDARPPQVFARTVKAVELSRFLGKGLDHPDARQHARQGARLFAGGIPVAIIFGIDAPPEEETATDDERGGNEGIESQLGVKAEKHDPHRDHLNDLKQEAPGNLLQ